VPVPSPALVEARDSVTNLVARWDDALATRIAADNLYLDEPKDRRRAQLAAIAEQHGTCRVDAGSFEVENALRGAWTMTCDRGWLRVSVTLAPTMPPKVQDLRVTPSMGARPPVKPFSACSAGL
jgi:hypothetical protein